jgi:putative ABC transport system permease protein
MTGHVPLARRNLFQDRRRAGLAVLGVAASLLLVLVLDGVFAGAMREVTAYIDHSPADVFVTQSGVKTMHMSVSSLPDDTVGRVQAVDGVAWTENLRYTTGVVAKGDADIITYVFGYDPTEGNAGPRTFAEGRAPGPGEVVVDRGAATDLGIHLGDQVNTTVFIARDDFTAIRGPGVNYVLVGAQPGVSADALSSRLAAALPDTTVQTRAAFSVQESHIVRDMATDIMSIMTVIGFLIALAVIALTLFTSTLSKLREYGIVKALGGTGPRLAADVLAQATWTVVLATLVAVGLTLLLGAAIGAVTSNIRIVVEPASVLRVTAGALVVGGLAAIIPLRRVISVDPASAFRRPS